jgi:hypothetical protein
MNHAAENPPLAMIASQGALTAGDGERRISSGGTVQPEHARQVKGDAFAMVSPRKFTGRIKPLCKR